MDLFKPYRRSRRKEKERRHGPENFTLFEAGQVIQQEDYSTINYST
jgi:hypothetical protein